MKILKLRKNQKLLNLKKLESFMLYKIGKALIHLRKNQL